MDDEYDLLEEIRLSRARHDADACIYPSSSTSHKRKNIEIRARRREGEISAL
jgi:hypothetical protein